MIIVPFQAEHALKIRLQPHQINAITDLPLIYLYALKAGSCAFTAIHNDEVIACGGITYQDPTLWGYISKDSGRCFIALHRIVKRLLGCQLRPVTAMVQTGFNNGCRWLELLGFTYDGIAKQYGLHGEDHIRYVWQPSSH